MCFRRRAHEIAGVLINPVQSFHPNSPPPSDTVLLTSGGRFLPASGSPLIIATGLTLIAIGQVFNIGVFYRLGNEGVFYGNRFGYDIAWIYSFPFSMLSHPQYVGTVLSIWGFFFAMRFPIRDWYLIPCLESL
jgi:phosphatidyl-N-methylethanolamine N-methyltransferase